MDYTKFWLEQFKRTISNEHTNEDYIKLSLKYRKLFNYYIINKLELKKYDRSILNSELNFKKVTENAMDVYQYLTASELDFLYIRNDIYIENLNEDEFNFLNNIENTERLTEDVNEFIERTFSRVITKINSEDEIGQLRFFGPATSNYLAPNNSIVIGIRYDDYYMNELSDEQWGIQREKQLDFLDEICAKIIYEQNPKTGNKTVIIHYNEFSIMEKEINEEEEER